jgi:nitric oxide reductase NorD protein
MRGQPNICSSRPASVLRSPRVPDHQPFERYKLLASAIAGRLVEVAPIASGMPAWTDAVTIFVAGDLDPREVLRSVAVQASLLGADSLAPEIVTKLERRAALRRRYLAIEGHRALAAHDDLLPHSARSLIDPVLAASSSSPAESLRLADSTETIAEPPPMFGTIRPRALRANRARSEATAAAQVAPHGSSVDDVAASDAGDPEEGPVFEFSSAWVGRGGAIGRLLKRLFGDARVGGSGAPGSDAPTRWSRSSTRVSSNASPTTAAASRPEDTQLSASRRNTYPEWDMHRGRYRSDWCTVVEVEAEPEERDALPFVDSRVLRRPLARVGLGLERRHRQLQGDDVDLDAAVEAFVARAAESAPEDACYVDTVRRARDLAVLVLLDISGSAGELGATGRSVHEHQRAAAAALTFALHDFGDRVALYGFRSLGRTAVHVVPVKRFDERLDVRVLDRLGALTPRAYTRLGAAIRHGAARLESDGGTPRRLLVVISDGFAYDHGYEGAYGEADARRALAEARRRGIGCLCLSIGAATGPDALRRVFGTAAHATLSRNEQLAGVVGPLFQAALRSAESQQRIRQRAERTRDRLAIDRRTA